MVRTYENMEQRRSITKEETDLAVSVFLQYLASMNDWLFSNCTEK